MQINQTRDIQRLHVVHSLDINNIINRKKFSNRF